MPIKLRDVFTTLELGQRFALNFLHCWTKKIFEDEAAVAQFLKTWWQECSRHGKDNDSGQAFEFIGQVAARAGRLWGKPVNIRRAQLSRVVSFTAFYSPPHSPRTIDHSLLQTQYLTDMYGIGLRSVVVGDVFKKLERVNGDAAAIRSGAQVRGSMPLSWATSKETFDEERAVSGTEPSDDLAWNVCRRLGLEGRYYLNAALFQLDYPPADTRDRNLVRRPTAIEGAGNRYFRARRDGDYRDNFGYTIDLNLFEARLDNVDGLTCH